MIFLSTARDFRLRKFVKATSGLGILGKLGPRNGIDALFSEARRPTSLPERGEAFPKCMSKGAHGAAPSQGSRQKASREGNREIAPMNRVDAAVQKR